MSDINELISRFENITENPKAQLKKALDEGKKCIGVMPCFAPEEYVYALGMMPFGLWGAQRQVSESKRYFPAFICSVLHTVLDLGIAGEFEGLSAVMIPMMCDSLKGMATNWKYGVKTIPVIDVPYAQNRKIPAGIEFTAVKYEKLLLQLEEIAGRKASAADIEKAVDVYNENRACCMEFSKLCGEHPELVSCVKRSSILKARYFMDRKLHTEWLKELNAMLKAASVSSFKGIKLVTTGIIADAPQLLSIFDDNRAYIAADQVLHESVDNMYPVEKTERTSAGFAERLSEICGTSVLFDPSKQRAGQLVSIAKKTGADGVVWIGTKFCDPEEFDYVPVKKALDENGIPLLTIEIDQQMENFEQIRTAVETFIETI